MWGEKHRNFRILESQKCLLFNLWLWDLVNRLCLPGLFSLTRTLNSEKIATLLISFSDVAGRSGELKAFLQAAPRPPILPPQCEARREVGISCLRFTAEEAASSVRVHGGPPICTGEREGHSGVWCWSPSFRPEEFRPGAPTSYEGFVRISEWRSARRPQVLCWGQDTEVRNHGSCLRGAHSLLG